MKLKIETPEGQTSSSLGLQGRDFMGWRQGFGSYLQEAVEAGDHGSPLLKVNPSGGLRREVSPLQGTQSQKAGGDGGRVAWEGREITSWWA